MHQNIYFAFFLIYLCWKSYFDCRGFYHHEFLLIQPEIQKDDYCKHHVQNLLLKTKVRLAFVFIISSLIHSYRFFWITKNLSQILVKELFSRFAFWLSQGMSYSSSISCISNEIGSWFVIFQMLFWAIYTPVSFDRLRNFLIYYLVN